jgi:flavin reductase (DIM6/NTAB) family NADH-FMN oxidoreductase RutF
MRAALLSAAAESGEEPVDQRAYRRAVSRFGTGVAIITARAGDDVGAMTANSFSVVSFEPAIIMVCVATDGRFHSIIRRADLWAVSILAEDQETVARAFARRGRSKEGVLTSADVYQGRATSVSLFSGAAATIECRTICTEEWGDHRLVLGSVLAVGDRGLHTRPLLYHSGQYARMALEPNAAVMPDHSRRPTS